jgi:hypothetical protein
MPSGVNHFQMSFKWYFADVGYEGGNEVRGFCGEFVVACSFRNVDNDFVWAFAGVYVPILDNVRSFLYEELAGLISWLDFSWCIGGDFNYPFSQ